MKVLDCHIHLDRHFDDPSQFRGGLERAGVTGGILLSLPPALRDRDEAGQTASERLDGVLRCSDGLDSLFPFYWIDPVSENAADEVAAAVEAGISGFKVICSDFYPGDTRALATYRLIAKAGKPILFHSGILWDGRDSSRYNRPAEFESLIDIEGLRFSLAHISWPWCDEHIAVYGKFLAARESSAEMFIDTTPGTPRIYRREALTKIFTVGYDVAENVTFGTDCSAPDYSAKWAREWVARDTSILLELGLQEQDLKKVFAENLERFIGVSNKRVTRRSLQPAE